MLPVPSRIIYFFSFYPSMWSRAAQIHNSVRNLDMETENEACWSALFILLSQLHASDHCQVMKCIDTKRTCGLCSPLASTVCAGVHHLQWKGLYSIISSHLLLLLTFKVQFLSHVSLSNRWNTPLNGILAPEKKLVASLFDHTPPSDVTVGVSLGQMCLNLRPSIISEYNEILIELTDY